MALAKITLSGMRPITKKNHTERTKSGATIQSKAYRDYESSCLWLLKSQWRKPPLTGRMNLCARYWMPNRSGEPDLIGLLQGTADILEKAGVVENDKYFRRFDGSEVVGIDKHNPRVEIEIELLEG